MKKLSATTVLVTGATDGLGRSVATWLAEAGAEVLVHGRDDARGERVVGEIVAKTKNERVHWYRADLASLTEVRELTQRLAAERGQLDVLVNNAGIGGMPGEAERVESNDGHELRFAVNYMAPVALTLLLEPVLAASAPARVINVGSAAMTPIDFDDVMLERAFDSGRAYCQSKLALAMFTFDEAEQLAGKRVTVNCVHPGTYMPTKIVLSAGATPVDPIELGLLTTLRLIVDPDLDETSGCYFDRFTKARAHPQAYDDLARARLREITMDLVASAVGR